MDTKQPIAPNDFNSQEEQVASPVNDVATNTNRFKRKPNFILVVLGLLAFILVGVGGYLLGKKSSQSTNNFPSQQVDNNQVACTEEAKECPDGSFVVRKGPNCEFEKCPAQSEREEESNSLSEHKSINFSFKYPNDWKVSEHKSYTDSNPITWNEMTLFDTPDKERVAFFQFKNVEEKNIEDLYHEYEEGGLGIEPEIHFLSTQKGLIDGNELLMSTMSDDIPPNGPAYSNSHDDQTFVLVIFWCDGNYYRLEYFGLNQGSNISKFESLLESFKCSSSTNGETEIPKIDKSLFIYPPVENFID